MGEWIKGTIIADYIGATIGIHSHALVRARQKKTTAFVGSYQDSHRFFFMGSYTVAAWLFLA